MADRGAVPHRTRRGGELGGGRAGRHRPDRRELPGHAHVLVGARRMRRRRSWSSWRPATMRHASVSPRATARRSASTARSPAPSRSTRHAAGSQRSPTMRWRAPWCSTTSLRRCPVCRPTAAGSTQARAALANVAGLHGPRWRDESLLNIDFLSPATEEMAGFLAEVFRSANDQFADRYRDRLDDDDLATLRDVTEVIGSWQLARSGPFAVVHGDYRLDNLMFSPTGRVTALDWQTVTVAPAARDAAYFLGTCLEPELRRAHERELFDGYLDALAAHGVEGYGGDDAFDDYRLGQLQGPMITVLGCIYATATPSEASDGMFLAMIPAPAPRSATSTRSAPCDGDGGQPSGRAAAEDHGHASDEDVRKGRRHVADTVEENAAKPSAPADAPRRRHARAVRECGQGDLRAGRVPRRADHRHLEARGPLARRVLPLLHVEGAAVPRGRRDPGGAPHRAARGSPARQFPRRIADGTHPQGEPALPPALPGGSADHGCDRAGVPLRRPGQRRAHGPPEALRRAVERAIRRWQQEGLADPKIDALAADALGAMVARFAELWLVQGYREYDFDQAVEQLTRIWANALQLEEPTRKRQLGKVAGPPSQPLSPASAFQHPAEVLLEGRLVERHGLAPSAGSSRCRSRLHRAVEERLGLAYGLRAATWPADRRARARPRPRFPSGPPGSRSRSAPPPRRGGGRRGGCTPWRGGGR